MLRIRTVPDDATPSSTAAVCRFEGGVADNIVPELARRAARDLERLDAVKWPMLEEWSKTKRAPQHAAWMHDGSIKKG